MDVQTLSSVIQGSLSIIGFIALSFWLMNWAKGMHERNKELGDIDKDIRVALKDSIAAQKELHSIERQKLELQLEELTSDIGEKDAAVEIERRILKAAINALDVADDLAQEIFSSQISVEYGNSREQFLHLIELLDTNGLIKKETFYSLDTLSPLPQNATDQQEMAWRLTVMHDARTRISAYAEAISVLAPTAVRYAIRNPDCSKQAIGRELAETLRYLKNKKS